MPGFGRNRIALSICLILPTIIEGLGHIQLFTMPTMAQGNAANALPASPAPPETEPGIKEPASKTVALPFIFSKSSSSVPAKIVVRIHSLKFVEMRELLPDNIALAERLATLPHQAVIHHNGSQLSSAQREVSSINSWACAFATYVAVLSQAHPTLVVSRLAYMRNIIREATRFGGDGWRTYDYVFRSQAAADASTDWTTTNPSLMLAYMQSGNQPAKPPCPLCHKSDHSSSSCALAPLSSPSQHWPPRKSPSTLPSRLPDGSQLCISWNQGNCIAVGRCRYRHVCGSCGEGHIARDCAQTPDDSIFKRPPKRPANSKPASH